MLKRPDWTLDTRISGIDLSRNVHYDKILLSIIEKELTNHASFHDYPNQYELYSGIATYYGIPINQLTIGYGATEIIERIFKAIPFDDIYIVEPTFEMVQVYCTLYNKTFHIISLDDLPNVSGGALYIANPSGNTGDVVDILPYISKFDLCLVDEAYADFYSKFSILSHDYDNVIVIKTLSKSLGIGGFRVGFCKASTKYTNLLQYYRSNFICTSFASKIIPNILNETNNVVNRMLITKSWLEDMFPHKQSHANYVLFKNTNKYTDYFNAKLVNGYYRMALADMETINI